MFGLHRKLSENLIIFVLVSFAFVSILGVGVGMSMKMTDSQMSSCPFMIGQESMCEMSITEHIAEWQATLTGIPIKTRLVLLALVLLTAALVSFAKPFSELKNLPALTERMLAYQRANFAKVFDLLLVAFSDGILNPKIYEPARI